jgi:hypothetical protein
MKILTDLRFYVVVATLSFTGLLVHYSNNLEDLKKTKEELLKCQTDNGYIPGGDITSAKEIDRLQKLSDSLRDESFIHFTEAGRYEVALEIYKEKNPKAVQEIELIKATQTE